MTWHVDCFIQRFINTSGLILTPSSEWNVYNHLEHRRTQKHFPIPYHFQTCYHLPMRCRFQTGSTFPISWSFPTCWPFQTRCHFPTRWPFPISWSFPTRWPFPTRCPFQMRCNFFWVLFPLCLLPWAITLCWLGWCFPKVPVWRNHLPHISHIWFLLWMNKEMGP